MDDRRHLALQAGALIPLRLQPAWGHHLPQPLPHSGYPTGLGHIEVRSLGRCRVHHVALDVAGQDQHLGAVFQTGQLIQNIQTVHPREHHLHDHCIRLPLPRHAQQLRTVSRLPYDLEPGILCQSADQSPAELDAGIRDQDPFDHLHKHSPFC